MDKAISALGLFEVVGYLIAGILFEAFTCFPWLFGPQLSFHALEPLAHIGAIGYVVLACLAYLAGIVISESSMLYYEGWGPIGTPTTHPTRSGRKSIEKPKNDLWMPTKPLWRTVHNRLSDRGIFDATTFEAHLEPNELQDIYMAQGYTSPSDVVMLLRIASVVRLAAATMVSCLAGIASSGVSFAFRHYFGQIPSDTLTCLGIFSAACAMAMFLLHRTSKKYAESFWRNLAAGIIVQSTAQ